MRAAKRNYGTIIAAAKLANSFGLEVHGGHGLNYTNVLPIAEIAEIVELNIGHSIIARAVFVGIEQAVREMKELLAIVLVSVEICSSVQGFRQSFRCIGR